MAAAKRAVFKPARMTANKTSNAALTQKVIAAEAKVEKARAQANLVKAKIEVQGKVVSWDYRDGVSIPKVVDPPKAMK